MFLNRETCYVTCRGSHTTSDFVVEDTLILLCRTIGPLPRNTFRRTYPLEEAVRLALRNYPTRSIVLVGHSLGGHHAEKVAVEFGLVSCVFNAPSTCFNPLGFRYDPISKVATARHMNRSSDVPKDAPIFPHGRPDQYAGCYWLLACMCPLQPAITVKIHKCTDQ